MTQQIEVQMQVLNIGSINIDHVYEVDHFVRPGETLDSLSYQIFAGGKGFNQSIALARAGIPVLHAGKIGQDAGWLRQRLTDEGVDVRFVVQDSMSTGHAVIQVVPNGENAIFLFAGANKCITEAELAAALAGCTPGDYLLLQNETNSVALAMQKAQSLGLRIVFNPAPMSTEVQQYPLEWVDIFILNQSEAEALTGKTDLLDVVEIMRQRFPKSATVLTQGQGGATYFDVDTLRHEAALSVVSIDTTAAGDTFIGYFLAELISSGNPASALAKGCRAATICVTRAGAADSIPLQHEVENYRP
jgi:ribokinase